MQPEKKYTILIVDDDEFILDILQDCLSDRPYNVRRAKTSEEAISIVRSEEVALLISDLNMSDDMDGNAILSAARDVNSDIVSVLMSGDMDREAMLTALNKGGVFKYLEKPLDMDLVRSVVEEGITLYVRHNRPQERLRALARKTTVMLNVPEEHDPGPAHMQSVKKDTEKVKGDIFIGDRYKLLDEIGHGGTGTVYRAEDQFLHTVVALKILHSHLTEREYEIAVLKKEARIAMTLSHRNIVRLHNFDRKDDHYFLVMEYVDGCSLRDVLLQDGSFPAESVDVIIRACASALEYAHEHGVIHQDLKPDNILLNEEGVVKIIDFGLACLAGGRQDPEHLAGTPVYMSPEQKRNEIADNRTDIYSLGIIAYELLTGSTPYPEDLSHMEILKRDADPLTGLKDSVLNALNKAVHPDRDERWQSVMAFRDALIKAVRK